MLSSCAGQQVLVPDPGKRPSQVTTTPMDSVNEPRQLSGIYDFGRMNYRYQATSIVHSIGGDSVPRTDSTRVTASLSVTFLEASSSRLRHAIAQAESIQV